jgi:hypothetical protein
LVAAIYRGMALARAFDLKAVSLQRARPPRATCGKR